MEEQQDIQSLLLHQQWEACFYQIVEQYTDRLYRVAFGVLVNSDLAQDCLQEAFISIWKNLHNFKGDSAVFTWTYTIVRNQAIALKRKEEKHRSTALEHHLHPMDGQELRWTSDEIQSELERALSTLPEKQKLVFELRYHQEMPYEAIAELTQTSVGALKASYHHAKEKIGQKLIEQLNLP